jgi:hypothetical protein
MRSILLRFWLDRFSRVFAFALVLLGLIQYLEAGSLRDYRAIVLWSGISALIAASVSTYWSYNRSCALPSRHA